MTDLEADRAAITALDAAWGAAIAARDVDGLVALYASNGTCVWPGSPPIVGSDAIRAAYAEMLKTPDIRIIFTPETITVDGDLAVDYGRVDMGMTTPSGPVTDVGKYVVAWTRAGGTWQVLYDSWNSNTAQG